MLELIDVTVARGATPVVSGLDLVIGQGRVFWIVGPNGAGKSSLLRVLVGLDPPRAGRVELRRPRGEALLYFHSEMGLPGAASVRGWERLVRRTLPEGCAGQRTALWPDVPPRRSARRLSTGERKRLLLDVLLRRPGSLVLDEPFEHLSPDGKVALGRMLDERAAQGRVVVVATNQVTRRASEGVGLKLEGGVAEPLPAGRRSGTW